MSYTFKSVNITGIMWKRFQKIFIFCDIWSIWVCMYLILGNALWAATRVLFQVDIMPADALAPWTARSLAGIM